MLATVVTYLTTYFGVLLLRLSAGAKRNRSSNKASPIRRAASWPLERLRSCLRLEACRPLRHLCRRGRNRFGLQLIRLGLHLVHDQREARGQAQSRVLGEVHDLFQELLAGGWYPGEYLNR